MARTAKTLLKIQNAGVPVSGFFDTLNLNTGISGIDLGFGVIEVDTSSGGYTVETPAGTVDGSNTAFTVTVAPVYIVIDGVTYFVNNGYTLSGLNLTVSVPPTGFIRSFHA